MRYLPIAPMHSRFKLLKINIPKGRSQHTLRRRGALRAFWETIVLNGADYRADMGNVYFNTAEVIRGETTRWNEP